MDNEGGGGVGRAFNVGEVEGEVLYWGVLFRTGEVLGDKEG